jgi:hypothetical protein
MLDWPQFKSLTGFVTKTIQFFRPPWHITSTRLERFVSIRGTSSRKNECA